MLPGHYSLKKNTIAYYKYKHHFYYIADLYKYSVLWWHRDKDIRDIDYNVFMQIMVWYFAMNNFRHFHGKEFKKPRNGDIWSTSVWLLHWMGSNVDFDVCESSNSLKQSRHLVNNVLPQPIVYRVIV